MSSLFGADGLWATPLSVKNMAIESKFVELLCEMGLDNRDDLNYKFKSNEVLISLPHCSKLLVLTENNVDELNLSKMITRNNNLVYYPTCGFSFDSYCEYFINLKHPDFHFYNWDERWPFQDKLSFKIGDDFIECGDSSSLAVLLLSQIYIDPDIDPDRLKQLSTLKIFKNSTENYMNIFFKSLYYLNSHYFVNTGVTASLTHLGIDTDYDEFHKLNEKLEKLSLKRIRNHKNFMDTNPLNLYNYACSLKGENKFLTFYRVLEYFFDSYKNKTVNSKRYDQNITDAELIKLASLKGELEYLKGLLKIITTNSVRNRLCKYAVRKKITKSNNFDELSTQLYSFRNSIVHAKESQIERTLIPDPFDIERTNTIKNWIYITRIFADLAISFYNKM